MAFQPRGQHGDQRRILGVILLSLNPNPYSPREPKGAGFARHTVVSRPQVTTKLRALRANLGNQFRSFQTLAKENLKGDAVMLVCSTPKSTIAGAIGVVGARCAYQIPSSALKRAKARMSRTDRTAPQGRWGVSSTSASILSAAN